jgi:hypothetical protein
VANRRPGPDEAARQFWTYFQEQRWGELYDMASDTEKALQPFTRDQYVGLMSDISATCLGEVGSFEMVGDWQSQTTSKHFEFTYEFSKAADPKSRGVVSFHCYGGPDRWHPSVYNMPLHIITPHGPGNDASRKLFYELCVKNGVKGFVRPTDKLVTSTDRLGEYLQGKRDYGTVSHYGKADAVQPGATRS